MKNEMKEDTVKEIRMTLIGREDYKKVADLLSKYIDSPLYNEKALINGIGKSSISARVFTKIMLMFLRKINHSKGKKFYCMIKMEKSMLEEIDFIIPVYNPYKTYTEGNVPEIIKFEALIVEGIVGLKEDMIETFIDIMYDWFVYLEGNTKDAVCDSISQKTKAVIA
jgi:uncharacterized protein (UPF0305 family)